jgi:hypothetical protein
MRDDATKPTGLEFKDGEAKYLTGPRGRIWVWRISPNAYASEVDGHLETAMADLIIAVATPLYANGPVAGFHNWVAMTGYESTCRTRLTQWVLQHRPDSKLYIALRSKLVAMGVSVANLALGNMIQTFSNEADLEAALGAFLRERAGARGSGR